VVGHDIGLMVAYAYAAQFPNETEKLAVMDAFLPEWKDGSDLRCAECLAFPFNGEYPEKLVQGRERTYFEYFWNVFAADETHSIPEASARLIPLPMPDLGGCERPGLTSRRGAISNGVRAALKDEAHDAGVVDPAARSR